MQAVFLVLGEAGAVRELDGGEAVGGCDAQARYAAPPLSWVAPAERAVERAVVDGSLRVVPAAPLEDDLGDGEAQRRLGEAPRAPPLRAAELLRELALEPG